MSPYPWQQQSWAELSAYRQQDRVPQALLIAGKAGMGKLHLAQLFAQSLLCIKPLDTGLACGHCPSCLLLHAETHPDFMHITPEEAGKAITIAQIRQLIGRLTLKPQFDNYRVVLVEPADALNTAAANAFLKCLEEPAERTVMVLISAQPTRLPATIRSRCQRHNLAQAEPGLVADWLHQQGVVADTAPLLSLALGAPLLALHYAQTGVLAMRNECFKTWLGLAKQQLLPVKVAEDWVKLPEAPLLFWITSWLSDIIKCCYLMTGDKLYNPDLHAPMQSLSQQLDIKSLYALYDLLLLSKQRLSTQINKQTLFEEILIKWLELNRNT